MDRDRFPVVVHVLLVRDAQVFLLRRARTGFMDGFFALPGGHQHQGEGPGAAAVRECREETGIEPLGARPVCVLPYRSGRHQGLNFVFEAEGWSGEPCIAEPELFDAAGWYALDDLPRPHAAWLPDVLRMRAAGDWYREFVWD